MSQQGLRQASVRAVSGAALDYNGDWNAMFNTLGIPSGTFNERMLAYIAVKLGATYTNLNEAMNALAAANGAVNFSSLGTFSAGTSIQSVVSSCVFDLDATQIPSYSGTGQVWSNIVLNPADSEPQTAYNFNLGSGSGSGADDPVFTGTAGTQSAYWALNGSQYFSFASGSNTTFLNAIQKTTGGTNFWFAIPFRFKSSGAVQGLFATNSATTQVGFRVTISATNQIQLQVRGDTGNVSTSASSFSALVDGTDYLYVVSMDGTTVRQWLNSPFAVEAAFTKNACTSNGTASLKIAAQGSGASPVASGTRVYSLSGGNGFIQDTDTVKIAQVYYGRQGRPYGFFP